MDEVAGTQVAPTIAARAMQSDPHDFAGLYIRHRSSFTAHARRYLRDQRDADEVVQEAFLRLFLALPELETELQALAYCRRTITNLCIDRFRAQARRPSLVGLDTVPLDVMVDDDQGDPVVRAEDAALVRAALSLLSPLHRAALVKREIEEKPLPLIAAELDIPEDSVKHLLFRARRALRRILTDSSLAPGGTGQLSEALAQAVSKGGMVVVAVMLMVIGLGSGPDLRTLPVVGSDLPDLPSIGQIVGGIGDAITGPAAPTAPTGDAPPPAPPPADQGAIGEPLPMAAPSPTASPTPAPAPASSPALPFPVPTASPEPSLEPATSTSVITPAAPATAPPSPSAAPSPSPSPSVTPSVTPSPAVSPAPSPTAAPAAAAPSPAASPSPAVTPSPVPPPAVFRSSVTQGGPMELSVERPPSG